MIDGVGLVVLLGVEEIPYGLRVKSLSVESSDLIRRQARQDKLWESWSCGGESLSHMLKGGGV